MKSGPYSPNAEAPLAACARALVILLMLYFVGAFAYAVSIRFRYPFELDLIEGGMLEQVRHVAAGQGLYAKPTLEFIAFIYGPLFTFLATGTSLFLGDGFQNLRLVSIAASIAACAAISLIVFRETANRFWASGGVALFLATYAASGYSLDQGRVDALFLALLLWAYYCLRFGSLNSGMLLSAALFSLAFFTKQIALIPIICLLPVAKYRGAKPFAIFLVALAILCGGGVLVLSWLTDGWYYYYCFSLPAQHDIRIALYRHFWISDLGLVFPIAFGLALYGLVRQANTSRDDRSVLNSCFLTGFLLMSWISRLHSGGIENVLAPAYAALSVLAMIGLASVASRSFGYALLSAQFLMLLYPATAPLPSVADVTAGDLVVKVISAYPGPVFVPYHPYLSTFAGKPSHAHHWALYDVLRGDRDGEGALLREQLKTALAEQKFSAVLSDDDWFKDEIEKYYAFHTKVFEDERVFRPVFGETRARPEYLYEPRVLIAK